MRADREEYERMIAFCERANKTHATVTVRASDGKPMFSHAPLRTEEGYFVGLEDGCRVEWFDAEPSHETRIAEERVRVRAALADICPAAPTLEVKK